MKSSLKFLVLGLLLLVPFATAHAQAPSLSPIANLSMNAGATATVNVVAVDVGGRPIVLTASLPSFATLNTPTSGTGVVVTTLTLTPSSANEGNYSAAVTATAGGVANVKVFQITVNAAGSNQAPVVTAPALQDVTVGSTLTFTVNASDADGDGIGSLDVSGLPTGATFMPNVSNTSGTFSWMPGAGDEGEYDLLFTASNSLSGAAVTHIHVESATTVAISPIDDVTVADGGSASVPVSATGMAGALVTLTASLPSFATLNPPGSGTGAVNTTITVAPPTGSVGTFHASVTATSLGVSVTELFDIIVTGSGGTDNHAPVLIAPESETVAIGSTLSFDVTATDADGDHVDLSGSALPPGATFTDNADNTGTFTWAPGVGQAGTYTTSFSGTDGRGGSGSASTMITVTGGVAENHAPTLSAPSTSSVDEGALLTFTVTASDADGDHVTLSANSMPSGATFSDQGNNTGIFSWTPGSTQAGIYNVSFVGDDGHGGIGTAMTTITVNDVGGGGGGEVPGKACLVGTFNPESDNTCFRIRPVNDSFDVRNVVPSSISLVFHGASIAALAGTAQLETDCHCQGGGGDGEGDGDDNGNGGGGGGGEHHGDGDDDHGGGSGDGDHHDNDKNKDKDKDKDKDKGHDAGAFRLSGDHPDSSDCDDDGDHDGDGCGISCEDHGDDCDHGSGAECDTVAIRACFSTQALLGLFAGATLPCDLTGAVIHATLTSGATVVATFGGERHENEGDDDKDKDKDKDKGKDKDKNKDKVTDKGNDGRAGTDMRVLNPRVRPNPLNPRTELSFTLSREGRVRVTVYDMQGRLVAALLDEVRGAGEQRLAWDGSNSRSQKVASGVYFFRIQAPEGEVIKRVAVVK